MLINPSQLLDWKQYQFFNRRIGKLTEYFVFPNVKLVQKDLYGMKPKVLWAALVGCDWRSGCPRM